MNSYVVNRYNIPTPGVSSQSMSLPTGGANPVQQFSTFDRKTKVIFLSVTGAGVLFTLDGSTPLVSNAHKLYSGSNYYFHAEFIRQAKFIRDPNTSANARIYISELTN